MLFVSTGRFEDIANIFTVGWVSTMKNYFCDKVLPRQSKIVGGSEAVHGQYPHQVFIKTVSNHKVSLCGGSLITDRHVLTAAHCLLQVDYAVLLFGSVYPIFTAGVAVDYATRSNFIIHPNYDSKLVTNDIAIIQLSQTLPVSRLVNTIRLPSSRRSSPLLFEGKEGIVTGWGSSDGSRRIAAVLQQAKVVIMKQNLSRSWFSSCGYKLSNSQLCTDFRKTSSGTGNGDSGGPLVIRESDDHLTLIGIISFGDVNCASGAPSVYTNVAMHMPWIRKVTGVNLCTN